MIKGLLETELMILVISPDSMASKWVREEWETYLKSNKKIFPIILQECNNIPAELQKIEMIKEANQNWYDELFKAVEQNL